MVLGTYLRPTQTTHQQAATHPSVRPFILGPVNPISTPPHKQTTQQTTDYHLKFLWFYSFVAATAVFIGVVHLRVSHRIHRDFKSLSNKSYKKDLIHINNKVRPSVAQCADDAIPAQISTPPTTTPTPPMFTKHPKKNR